jgi:ABC-type bacteriocin/lantibiotic exporter with double-glycine peptidase domain
MDNKSAGRIYRYIIKNYSDKILIMVNHQTKLVNRNDDYVIIENGKIKKKDD